MKLGIFITGTDTGIGKTVVSSLIVSSLKSFGIRRGYFKPIQSGPDSDVGSVASLARVLPTDLPQPTYLFDEPAAPYRIALNGGEMVQLDRIERHWSELEERAWVVEGCGGLLCPLNAKQTVRELIQVLKLRTVLVAATRLGTMNHTLLSVEAARAAGLNVVGIVLVGSEDPGLDGILTDLTGIPVIAQVPWFESVTPEVIQEAGPRYFPVSTLRFLYD